MTSLHILSSNSTLRCEGLSEMPAWFLLPWGRQRPCSVSVGHFQPAGGPGRVGRLQAVLRREGLHAGGSPKARRGLHARVSRLFVFFARQYLMWLFFKCDFNERCYVEKVCLPSWLLQTQRTQQRLPTRDAEQSDWPHRPLAVSAVPGAIRVSSRCRLSFTQTRFFCPLPVMVSWTESTLFWSLFMKLCGWSHII